MNNSMNQNPCLVKAWLMTPCHIHEWKVSALNRENALYSGPAADRTDLAECDCNTVTYSLLAACAYCQGRTDNTGIVSWRVFTENCERVIFGKYPQSIPSDTVIPDWAHNPLQDGRWDANAAFLRANDKSNISQSGGSPSSTFASSRSENYLSPTPSPPSQSTTECPTVSSIPTNSNKGIASLAIGGTTACLAGLLGIAMGVWLYLRARGRLPWHKSAPDLGIKNHARPLLYVRPVSCQYPVLLTAHPPLNENPDDPSTYPASLTSRDDGSLRPAPRSSTIVIGIGQLNRPTSALVRGGTAYAGMAEIQ
ncbi:hypothetical protein C8Q74DRAFT_227433 [Fomes fomentarius]|nr:hypothetical protein C8Q74DRAFT_227433 [Fomes fomentarius]